MKLTSNCDKYDHLWKKVFLLLTIGLCSNCSASNDGSDLLTSSQILMDSPGLTSPLSSGRFTGVLEHTQLQKQQLAKLELIMSRGQANQLQIQAILTLYFGDFRSGEYIA